MKAGDSFVPPRAVVADDHEIVRSALAEILREIGVEIVAEAANGLECVAQCRAHMPDLLTLDAGMPFLNGMEAFHEVRRWSPTTKVCLVTGFTAIGSLTAWIASGVNGLVLKSAPRDELSQTFRNVLEGMTFVAPSIEERINAETIPVALTAREIQVLGLLARGMRNSEVATRLSISPKTVDNHRTRLMRKLGAQGIGQLVAFALREGWLDASTQL